MKWNARPHQQTREWHRWFAWYPVRIPFDPYVVAEWIWLEMVDRRNCMPPSYCGSLTLWNYRLYLRPGRTQS